MSEILSDANAAPRGNLIVTLKRYTTTVECIPPAANPPTVESCNQVLQAMPASTDMEVFSRYAAEGSVHVPWFLVNSRWHPRNLISVASPFILHRSSRQGFMFSSIPKRHFPPSSSNFVLCPTCAPLVEVGTRLTSALRTGRPQPLQIKRQPVSQRRNDGDDDLVQYLDCWCCDQ